MAKIQFPGGDDPSGPGGGGGVAAGVVEDRPDLPEDLVGWRKRALAAERERDALKERIEQAQRDLEEARRQAEAQERGRAIDLALLEAGVVDLASARRLLERGEGDESPAAAVAALRRASPWLFAGGPREPGVMGGEPGPARDPLREARETARCSGDRRQLLRYLRLKRGAN